MRSSSNSLSLGSIFGLMLSIGQRMQDMFVLVLVPPLVGPRAVGAGSSS